MEVPHSQVWLGVRLATLFCSVCGSCWLLRAAWKPSYLFTRQLRHLAVADLGLSLVAPGYELGLWLRNITFISQCLFRFFLCTGCFIETEIAAGVMCSALRWQRCPRVLARSLIISWMLAALIEVIDAVSARGDLDHFAAAVAVVLCTTFLLSLLMYVISMLAVLWTPSPSAVVRRASQRALAFPCSFLITVFPQWLLYIGMMPKHHWFRHVATLAVYSNGWVNSAVYSWQNRHICGVDWRRVQRVGRHSQENGRSSRSSLGQSFHVGFGRVSRFYPQTVSSEALSESSKETTNCEAASAASGRGELGLHFEFHGEGCEELCINAHIDSYVLLQGHAMTLRQDGLLWFSTRPIWLDVTNILGDNWAEGGGSISGHIQVEYYRSFGQRGPCKSLQLPLHSLHPGLWLVSESAERAVSLVPMSEMRSVHSPSEEIFTVLSPSHGASSASIQSGDSHRREVDGWAAFLS